MHSPHRPEPGQPQAYKYFVEYAALHERGVTFASSKAHIRDLVTGSGTKGTWAKPSEYEATPQDIIPSDACSDAVCKSSWESNSFTSGLFFMPQFFSSPKCFPSPVTELAALANIFALQALAWAYLLLKRPPWLFIRNMILSASNHVAGRRHGRCIRGGRRGEASSARLRASTQQTWAIGTVESGSNDGVALGEVRGRQCCVAANVRGRDAMLGSSGGSVGTD